MYIGLNAHLLSSQLGYRAAGIHGYIYNTLTHLGEFLPDDWRVTAMVSKDSPHQFPKVTMRHAMLNTESPLKRILWEQTIQPFVVRKFDLFHAMTFVSPVALTRPSVVTVYDLSFVHYPQVLSSARRMYLRTLTEWSCKRARRVIAISQSTAQDVHQTFGIPLENIDVALGGYDETRLFPLPQEAIDAFRKEKGLPERFWLFIGTLEPRKNITTLLDAYAQLPVDERLPLVLGGGKGWDYAPIFERIQRYGLEDWVTTPGFIPADELALWYNSAEVFLYPSIYEGFGLPVLEAMACGTPVVIADASSLPEVGGVCGLTVPPLDRDAWAAALRRVYADSAWRQAASLEGIQAAKAFTWRQTAHDTVRAYERAMN
jgi:glycosyltransferase involved in cell wall biosynthesis